MGAGWLQEQLGYTAFFVWACSVAMLRIDPAFGRKG